jgi:hypothetical protein
MFFGVTFGQLAFLYCGTFTFTSEGLVSILYKSTPFPTRPAASRIKAVNNSPQGAVRMPPPEAPSLQCAATKVREHVAKMKQLYIILVDTSLHRLA